jgi:hypothetical protein
MSKRFAGKIAVIKGGSMALDLLAPIASFQSVRGSLCPGGERATFKRPRVLSTKTLQHLRT